MISVFIVDSNDEISSAVGESLSDPNIYVNEVKLFNAMERKRFAIILLHHAVRGPETATTVRLLKNTNPAAEIVVIGNDQSDEEIIACVMAGANGYERISSLALYAEKMLRVVEAGEAWISRKMVVKLLNYWRKGSLVQ